MKHTTNRRTAATETRKEAARMPAPAPDGSTAADPAAVDPAAALPGAPDAIRAAVDALKAARPDDIADNLEKEELCEDDYLDLCKEAKGFYPRNPAEVLHDFKVQNWYEFYETAEPAFSGYDVKEIAEDADRSATESATRTLVYRFLQLNHNDRAALDLFAAAARFSEAGEKEIDELLNSTRDDISERIRKIFSEALPPDVLERIIKEIHR